jgi:hypothetical protein
MSYGIEHIRYIQGSGRIEELQSTAPMTEAPLRLRRLWQIHGIGVTEKHRKIEHNPNTPVHLPTLDLLMGLYGFRVPIAFSVRAEEERLSISMGTFLPQGQIASPEQAAKVLAERNRIVQALLQATFRSVDSSPADPLTPEPQAAGIVIGIPSVKPPDLIDGALPLDRLVRALSGTKWGFLVLAEPVLESTNIDLRLKAIEDLKGAKYYLKTLPFPDPLSEHYSELLEATVNDYTYGAAIGGWRTSVFLHGDESDYSRLGAVWQGIFSGDRSLHMPIRIARHNEARQLVRDWKYSDLDAAKGPGGFRHLYRYQTILSSDQLAAYVHLPHLETSGFSVELVPNFDVMPAPQPQSDRNIMLGHVVSNRRVTNTPYAVPLASLRSHVFVAGVTNSGKTNTLLGILNQVSDAGIPFLVVEPAKAEYRILLNRRKSGKSVRVFTLGNERVSPFRLNPFEPVAGTSISVHLDLLRSAFNASFGMWNPLPQVLEQCLHAVYADRGWILSSDTNVREGARSSRLAYPTLSDLIRKVDEITPQLGYDDKIAGDVRAALRTRLSSLSTGGKGRMLDVRTSIPPEDLFDGFTILELEEMGDDDDKAFVMALILIRSWEYLKSLGQTNEVRHLLIVEEAHRLLSNVAHRSGEEGNPRGKAVESFTNLLSEIRAYGQGVVIVDQVPVRLAPDVIKNTNLKIVHRVVAQDDRTALAGAMAMTDQQSLSITTFNTGYSAIYSKGEDAPLLVKIEPTKDEMGKLPGDAEVRDAMRALGKPAGSAHWECAASFDTQHHCDTARSIAESAEYQRDLMGLVLSAAEGSDAVALKLWPALASHIAAARRGTADIEVVTSCTIARGAELLADSWGARMSWPYPAVEELAQKLRALLMELADGGAGSLSEFKECVNRLTRRTHDPFPQCSAICSTQPFTCLYRHAAEAVAGDRSFRSRWADEAALDIDDPARGGRWNLARDASYIMLQGHNGLDGSASRAALCFSQLMLAADKTLLAEDRAVGIANIMRTASQPGVES